MTTTLNLPYEGMARRSLEAAHYRTAVMAMAERKIVLAVEDIYTADGTKLVAAGTRIRGEPSSQLFAQKLFKPLDLSLVVEDGITAESLLEDAAGLCARDDHLRQLAAHHDSTAQLQQSLLYDRLPSQMGFKLSVAREQRPLLYRHLLTATLIAAFLARGRRLPETDTAHLLAATLFHDLGELYTDPALLAPDRRIGERERRYIYAHPIAGYLLVKDIAGIDDAVAVAVLQHQERLDGSGYPLGLRAKRIGPLARIVAVADVCSAILERFGSSRRLSTLMRLNRQKYDGDLVALLHEGFASRSAAPQAANSATLARLNATVELLARWDRFRAALARECGGTPPHALIFIFERMVSLRVSLLQFGFDPDSLRLLMDAADDDAQIATEMAAAMDEVRWQFADLEHEIARRRETIAPVLSDRLNRFLDNWSQELRAYPEAPPSDLVPPADGPKEPETTAT